MTTNTAHTFGSKTWELRVDTLGHVDTLVLDGLTEFAAYDAAIEMRRTRPAIYNGAELVSIFITNGDRYETVWHA